MALERSTSYPAALNLAGTSQEVARHPLLSPSAAQLFVRNRVRKILFGRTDKGLRASLQAQLMQPVGIRLRDKFCFTAGVINVGLTQFLLFQFPAYFWIWYTIWGLPLLIWRYITYNRRKYQYFLLDFCYTVNVLCYLHIIFPSNRTLFEIAFVSASGPLAFAILAWRNSLVFHDVEKVTSLFIHIMPTLLMMQRRWYYGKIHTITDATANILTGPLTFAKGGEPVPPYLSCSSDVTIAGVAWRYTSAVDNVCYYHPLLSMVLGLGWYILWQGLYFLKTEVIDHHKLSSDPELSTSLRWLARSTGGFLHDGALALTRRLRILHSQEMFDPDTLKTKLIFMSAQLLYTFITLLPTLLMLRYFSANIGMILMYVVVAIWNGGCYYFDVFAERYLATVQKHIAAQEKKLDAAVLSAVDAAADVYSKGKTKPTAAQLLQPRAADTGLSSSEMAALHRRTRSSSGPGAADDATVTTATSTAATTATQAVTADTIGQATGEAGLGTALKPPSTGDVVRQVSLRHRFPHVFTGDLSGKSSKSNETAPADFVTGAGIFSPLSAGSNGASPSGSSPILNSPDSVTSMTNFAELVSPTSASTSASEDSVAAGAESTSTSTGLLNLILHHGVGKGIAGGFDFGALADGIAVPSPVAEAAAAHVARKKAREQLHDQEQHEQNDFNSDILGASEDLAQAAGASGAAVRSSGVGSRRRAIGSPLASFSKA